MAEEVFNTFVAFVAANPSTSYSCLIHAPLMTTLGPAVVPTSAAYQGFCILNIYCLLGHDLPHPLILRFRGTVIISYAFFFHYCSHIRFCSSAGRIQPLHVFKRGSEHLLPSYRTTNLTSLPSFVLELILKGAAFQHLPSNDILFPPRWSSLPESSRTFNKPTLCDNRMKKEN